MSSLGKCEAPPPQSNTFFHPENKIASDLGGDLGRPSQLTVTSEVLGGASAAIGIPLLAWQ